MSNKQILSICLAMGLAPAWLVAQDREPVNRCYLVAINDVLLAADETGKLIELFVDDGASVSAGDVIAQIDDADAIMAQNVAKYQYEASHKKAKNDISVRAAVASKEVAEVEYEQILKANEKRAGSYTESETLRARLNRDRSGLQIQLAQHEMEVAEAEAWAAYKQYQQAESMVERRKLKAPFSGVVDQVLREQGEWVSAGDAVVHLVQMDRLRVHGRIDKDRFHPNDVQGRPVEVIVQLPGGVTHTVNSQIGFASPVIEEDGAFRVWAEIENTQVGDRWLLGPGFAATMQLR